MSVTNGKLLLCMFLAGSEGFLVGTNKTPQNNYRLPEASFSNARNPVSLNALKKSNDNNGFRPFKSIRNRIRIIKDAYEDFMNRILLLDKIDKKEDDYLPQLKDDILYNYDIFGDKHTKDYYIYKDDEKQPNEGRGEHIKIPNKFLDRLIDERGDKPIKSIKQLVREMDEEKNKGKSNPNERGEKTFVQRLNDPASLGDDDWMSLDDDCFRL